MLKLGVLGAGRMGATHATVLRNHPETAIHGVYDPIGERAEAYAKKFNVQNVYSSFNELAADQSLDAVLICNYTHQHYDTILKLLNAGHKNIFCEKAIVRRLPDGENLLQQVKKAGAKVMVGHHRRYAPGYIALHKSITEGRLGKIRMAKIHVCVAGYARLPGDFFADFDRCGGVTLDMMTHLFDQLNWYFGEPDCASARSIMMSRSQPLPMDYVSGTLVYKNNVICNIDGSWQRYGVGEDSIEVYGDAGTAIYKNDDRLHIYRPGEHTELIVGNPNPYELEMNAFVKMIQTGEKPINGLKEGVDSARVALGMIQAAKSGKVFNFK